MDTQTNISIRYCVSDENKSAINALVHNECEKNLLLSIKNLQKFTEDEFEIEVVAKEKGSLIVGYLILATVITAPLLKKLVDSFISNFFRPKIHRTEEALNKADIIDKIKKGDYTQEEFDYIASSDTKLMKLKSNFYKSASKDTEISKIETAVSEKEPIIINYNEFHFNIIELNERYETQEVLGATIYIVSPILIKIPNAKSKWRGIYNSKPIDFAISDKSFLMQVKDHEISFASGTKITCSLEIFKKTKIDEIGEKQEEYSYSVTEVQQWEDDKHFVYETKKYKKIIEERRQGYLFSEESF